MPNRSPCGLLGSVRLSRLARRRRALVAAVRRHFRSAYYRFQLLRPIKADLAVYAAYWYRGYACNPRAIYEKAADLVPEVRGVWVVRKSAISTIPPGVDYVVAGSLAYLRLMARAKYFVNNCNFPGFVVKRRGTVHLMTQHGTPLKAMGLDLRDFPAGAGVDFTALLERTRRWDLMISANPLSSSVWRRGFPGPYELLEIGHPRNDRLVAAAGPRGGSRPRAELRAELGVEPEATARLYAPTHRDGRRAREPMLDIGAVIRALDDDHVLLLRAHYFDGFRGLAERYDWPPGRVIDVSRHPSVEELCLASDMLITDYSSIMFDYANLDRPIVIHAPDWERYRDFRGVYFDLIARPPGPVAADEAELIEIVRSGAARDPDAAARRADFRRRYCPWDDGRAAERAVRRLFADVLPAIDAAGEMARTRNGPVGGAVTAAGAARESVATVAPEAADASIPATAPRAPGASSAPNGGTGGTGGAAQSRRGRHAAAHGSAKPFLGKSGRHRLPASRVRSPR
jgi:CDP-glycerol glycerophosphotransferase